jgi:hypothetical protein
LRGRIGIQPGFFAGPAVLLLAILLFIPLSAFSDAGNFVPTIYSTRGDLELNMSYENDENTSGNRGTRTTDSFASERLILYLDGYVYHPRFIQFLMKGAPGLSQERYVSSQIASFSDNSIAADYEFRAKVLPEHPYNLEMYAMRTTPLNRMSSAETRPTITENGAIFDYAYNPLFLNAKFIEGETTAHLSSSAYRTESVNGSYLVGPFGNSAAYSHTDSSTSLGMNTENDYSDFENDFRISNLQLDSKLSQKHMRQSSLFAANLNTDNFSWMEQLNAELPLNFSASANYDLEKYSLITEETALQPRQESDTDTRSGSFTLAHKLYDSVRTFYSYNQTSSQTSSGDSKTVMNSLNGIYTKKIPTGRLTVGVQGSRSKTDRDNAPLILLESYTAALFRSFTITRDGINPDTVKVKVLADDGSLVDLVQDVNYILEFFGNSVTITIILLPPQISSGHPAGFPFTFYVTYSLAASNVKFETTTAGYNINLSLVDNLINPYFGYLRSQQVILEGFIPGGPQETTTTVIGIIVQKAPFSLMSESRTIDSTLSPSRSLRNIVEYSKRTSDTSNLYTKAEHSKTVYGRGAFGNQGFTENVWNLNAIITQNIPRQKLVATATATYTLRHSTFDSELYAVTGNLTWKLGELSLNSGATLNRSVTSGTGERQELLSQFFYLTVSRRLF